VEVAKTAIIADSSKERQGVNSPAVFINRSNFVFVQVDVLLGVKVDEELVIKREINGFRLVEFNIIAPDLLIVRCMQGGIDREIEVLIIVGIVANPANAALLVEKAFGERVDEGIFPPRMFQKFGESVLIVDRAVKNFTVQTVLIAKNR